MSVHHRPATAGRADHRFARVLVVVLVVVLAVAMALVGLTAPSPAHAQQARGDNVADDPGVTLSATYTEPGYGTAGLVNGVLDDKAWSNWRSGTKNPGETITLDLGREVEVASVDVVFFDEGGAYARTLQVEARDADGSWAAVTSVVDGPPRAAGGPTSTLAFDPVVTDAVRVVMTAHDASYLVVSEIQVFEPADPTLLLAYDLTQGDGSTVADLSGNGNDGALLGDPVWTGTTGLRLDGQDDAVSLPDDLLAGLDAVTVAVDVLVDPGQATPYFVWGLGNEPGDGMLFLGGEDLRAAITPTNWTGEQVVRPSPTRNLRRGVWTSLVYTQDGAVGTLYQDGVQIAQRTDLTVVPGDIGDGTTTRNVLGDSNYDVDPSLFGNVRAFTMWDRALSGDEVAAEALPDQLRVDQDADLLDLGDTSAVVDDLDLPTTGTWGSAITWASRNPAVVAPDGTVTRPLSGEPDTTVTLVATLTSGDVQDTVAVDVTVLADATDEQLAQQAADAIDVVHGDDVRGHLFLPTEGARGAAIEWTSSDPGIVSPDGLVDRPADGDATVTLTATVTVGDATITRDVEVTVRQAVELAEFTGYAFSYFTGSSIAGEKIFLAASEGNDALTWQELNDGDPVLESSEGTRGLRDPFLIRSPEGDRFFLIATDLSIGRNGDWGAAQRNGSRYLEIWESTDLVNWSEQRHVLVSPDNAGNTWAPEAYWDEANQEYIVFWASKLYETAEREGETYNRMLYATTRDFVHFSDAKVWQDYGASRIDTTIIQDGDTYHRFTKDEGAGTTGCSDIIQEKSTDLTSPDQGDWAFVAGCIGRDAGTGAVEGATGFHANPGDTSPFDTYLFVDEYGGRGYIPLGTNDLDDPDWTIPDDFDLPANPRHGTVLPVTQAEHDVLLQELGDGGGESPDPLATTQDGLILHYPMDQADGTVVEDVSGNDHDATVVGGGTWTGDALELDGVDGRVDLPDDLMAGLDEITVSMDVWIDPTQPTPFFVYGFGNSTSGVGDGYLFTTGNAYRTSIATGNWTTEQTVSAGGDLPRGAWTTITYTLAADDVATLYRDGVQVGENTDVTIDPGDIGDGVTDDNWIGRSLYTADASLDGRVRDVMVYARALDGREVAGVAGGGIIVDVELDSLKVPAIVDPTASTVVLPVVPGTDLTSLDPTFVVADGATVSPDGPHDLSEPVTVTVTGADGATREWEVSAVEMRSPVLPGLYADPNIAEFDGTYYVYATSDGYPGWGGREFFVWSSDDLANWTRSEEPILTLDGVDGDVPWATGNAWAPTIIERDGSYYFYFSGQNASLGRKTIGVAVADDPLGPFTAEPEAMILNDEAVTSGQAIDPAAFTDPATGTSYLFWGNGSPLYAELSDDMTSIVPDTITRIDGLPTFREGLFVNERDGTYHLTYSIDDTGSPDYRVGYATSSSIDGPWTSHGLLLEKDPSLGILGTGHSSILNVPGTDDWYVAYHRFAIPGGDGMHRETTIDRLEVGEDGLFQPVVPTLSSIDPLDADEGQPLSLDVVVDPAAPDGRDGWYVSPVTVTATTNDDATIEFSVDGGEWVADDDGVIVIDADGSHTLDVRAVRGDETSQVQSLAMDIDTTNPELVVDGITDGQVFAQGGGDEVTWSATDATSGVRIVRVRLDGVIIDRDLPAGGPFVPGSLEPGSYELFVRAHDVAGNAVTQRLDFTVTPPPDTTRPTITVTGVRNGGTYGDSRVLDIVATATDSESDLDVLRVWLDDDRIHNGDSPFELVLGLWDLDLGEHTMKVVARDSVGNRRATTITFTVGTSITDVLINLDRFTEAGLITTREANEVATHVQRAERHLDRFKLAQARTELQKARDKARDIDDDDVQRLLARDLTELIRDLD